MSGSSSLHHLLNPEPRARHSQTPPPSHQQRQPSPFSSDTDPDSDDFFTLEDSEDDEDMPPSTRNGARRHSVVDLTDTPDRPDPQPPSRQPAPKRKRSTDEGPAPRKHNRRTRDRPDIEEYDLTEENPSVEEEMRQQQQQATIRQQQAEVDAGPQKIGSLQCIICMDSYTNATATACGLSSIIWAPYSFLTSLQATSTATSAYITHFWLVSGPMSAKARVQSAARPYHERRSTTSFRCRS